MGDSPRGGAGARAESLGDRVRSLQLPQHPTTGRWRAAIILLVLLAAGVLAVAGYLKWPQLAALSERKEPPKAVEPAKPSPPPVAAIGNVTLERQGYVIPKHQILVSPKVSGMIVRLNIEEGRRVKKGDVLAEIESVDYKADSERAKAVLAATRHKLAELERGNRPDEIAQVKAELGEAQAQRDQLYSAWKRNVPLRGTRVLTENDYELAESQYKAIEQRVARLQHSYNLIVEGPRIERIEVARAEVAQAEAELAKAEWRLENCTIRAPVSGTILKKNAEEGNIVNPIAFNGSFSVCEMADLAELEVELSIQERDIARVHQGQQCKVRPDAFPDRVYEGVVSRLMPIADRAKGAVPVRVKLTVPPAEEGIYLKPEMGATVSFLKGAESEGGGL